MLGKRKLSDVTTAIAVAIIYYLLLIAHGINMFQIMQFQALQVSS